MKYQHIQRIYKDPFYVRFKKHYCPDCGAMLKIITTSKIVNSKSEDAENFDFEFGESFMIGNVKFIWDEFECPVCGRIFSIKEMKQIGKEQGKRQERI